jgi:hypothetical protein
VGVVMDKKTELTEEQKKLFERWVIENISAQIVPADEGNDETLLFNLIHAIRGDREEWDYLCHQYTELYELGIVELEDGETLDELLYFMAKDHPKAGEWLKEWALKQRGK